MCICEHTHANIVHANIHLSVHICKHTYIHENRHILYMEAHTYTYTENKMSMRVAVRVESTSLRQLDMGSIFLIELT